MLKFSSWSLFSLTPPMGAVDDWDEQE